VACQRESHAFGQHRRRSVTAMSGLPVPDSDSDGTVSSVVTLATNFQI
jgi:hypothetical protein